jgi:hypothetical protein
MDKFIHHNVINMLRTFENIYVIEKDVYIFVKDGLQCHVFYHDNFDFVETYMVKSNTDFRKFIKEFIENK